MILAIRSASDLIHRKRLLKGCFLLLLQGFRVSCHYHVFPGWANCFRKQISVIRKYKILLCTVDFSGFFLNFLIYLFVAKQLKSLVQMCFPRRSDMFSRTQDSQYFEYKHMCFADCYLQSLQNSVVTNPDNTCIKEL